MFTSEVLSAIEKSIKVKTEQFMPSFMLSYPIDKSLGFFLIVYTMFIIEIVILIILQPIMTVHLPLWGIIIMFIISAILTPIGYLKQRSRPQVS